MLGNSDSKLGRVEKADRKKDAEKWEYRRQTSPLSFIFSSSLYGAYHLARRVLPLVLIDQLIASGDCGSGKWQRNTYWRFWMRMKDRTIFGMATHELFFRG